MSNLHNRANDPFFCDEVPEIRSIEGTDGGLKIFGYWALYNQESRVLTTPKGVKFREKILPGAFDNTDFSDAESLFNHRDYLASAPNLRHGVDARGAWYEFDYDPQDSNHVSAMRRIQRREVKGSSFQFPGLPQDCYTIEKGADGILLRSVNRHPRVLEFGPVITPAYSSTTAFARSLDEMVAQEELKTLEDQQQQQEAEKHEAETRQLLQQRQHQSRVLLATHTL